MARGVFLNKDYKLKRLLLLSLVSLVTLASCRSRKPGEVVFEKYSVETSTGQTIDAQLGRLTVPENRNNPQGRLIELAFVLLKSNAKNPEPPIIFLSGGPGTPAIDHLQGARSPVLLALRENGDVVLLDQRGTGLSKPQLSCDQTLPYPLTQPAIRENMVEAFKRQARLCAEQHGSKVDLNAYNTEESASDVNALREALGVDKISLLGSSYGTTLALTTIRRYGEHVHRVIMIGVEAPDQTIKLPENGQEQLLKLAKLWRVNFNGADGPELLGMLTTVYARLRDQPATVDVDVDDPDAGQKVAVTVGDFDLKLMTAMSIGYDAGIREFPAALYSMMQGDYSALGKWALHFRRQRANPTHAAMDCASGASVERWNQIQAEEKIAFLGREFDFPFPDVCEAWGVRQLEPPFRSEIRSNVQALFISGTLDGRTPVSNAEEVRKGFPNSTMVIIEGAAHGDRLFVGSPQITAVMLDFMKGKPISVSQIVLGRIDFEPLR